MANAEGRTIIDCRLSSCNAQLRSQVLAERKVFMKQVKVRIIDNIHAQAVDGKSLMFIRKNMTITREAWRQTKYKKEMHTYPHPLVDKKNGIFLAGFMSRLAFLCEKNDHELIITNPRNKIVTTRITPQVPGIIFREDQTEAVNQALLEQRGVVVAATGTGKTILAKGIINAVFAIDPRCRILYLVHNKDICEQIAGEFELSGMEVGRLFGGKKEVKQKVIVATRQSAANHLKDLCGFDCFIVDEVHHVAKLKSQYATLLQSLNSPFRIGLTAKLKSTNEEAVAAVEGLIGKTVFNLSINQARDLKILAEPKIKLIRVPYCDNTAELRTYKDIYQVGIVEYQIRNRLIAREIDAILNQGNSVLVFVTKIEHGERIQDTVKQMYDRNITFVHGDTIDEVRNKAKVNLQAKTKGGSCVIASVIWKEGINIPSLDSIINAGGGKSDEATIQMIGRALRLAEGKTEVTIVDFLDDNVYLSRHTVKRLHVYVKNNWL